MQTKQFRVIMSVFLIAMVAMALGFSSQSAMAGSLPAANAQDGGGGITSDEDGVVSTAATRPWTAAEMRAARPYPLARIDKSSAPLSSDPTLGPTGPAGSVPGARPGAGLTSADSLEEAVDSVGLAVNPLGYTYPAPFTRFHIGAISAYTTYPLSTIGKLFFKQGGVSYVCSASVVGVKGIVTAGHCVHKGNGLASGWSTNVIFVPAYRSGAAPLGQWPIQTLKTFPDWYNNGAAGDFDHDWGAGRTTQVQGGKFLGQKTGYLGYAYNFSRQQDWWLLGYPQASPFNGALMQVCTSSYAYNSPFYTGGPAPISVGCDQTGGTSGGPWIKNFGTGNYINSVNSHRATVRPKELSGPYADSATKTLIFDWVRLP